ncbi:MAG: alpha/beta hydrolase [Casimicrobiaceae bacterium]
MRLAVDGHSVYAYTGARAVDAALPTIAFVHGAALDHSVWALQSRYLAHHGYNVVAVDLPGHGRSGGAALSSIRGIADWILALLDATGIAQATLIGHSMGSLAVLDAAGRFPQRVSRVALLGPSVPMPVADALQDAARADEQLAYEMITGWSFSAAHQLGGNQQPGMWMTGNGLRLMERCAPGVLHTDLLACHEYADGLAAAATLRCPVLLLIGERDMMAPCRNAQALIAALDNPSVITIADCGHSLMAEAPDAVLDALREFLLHDASVRNSPAQVSR